MYSFRDSARLVLAISLVMLLSAFAFAASASAKHHHHNHHRRNHHAKVHSRRIKSKTKIVTASAIAAANDPVMLGDQNIESVSDGGTNSSEAFGYTATVTGTAQSISVYLTSTRGAQVALYADNSGKPGARLGMGSVTSNTVGWVTIPISGSASITSGTRYWLAIASTSGRSIFYRDKGSSGSNLDWSLNGLANPASTTGQWSSNPASVYLNGTAAPPPPPPPPPPPSNTTLPAISGNPQQGSTLTTSNGSWSGDTPFTYSYQWQRCASFPEGPQCSAISGATSQTYTVQTADEGDTLQVAVTAQNDAGQATAISKPTATVTAPSTSGLYQLPSDRTYPWNPGLNSIGGIPNRTSVSATVSPSGGDDTATIQAALDNCPTDGVVKLAAGVFHISGQGLFIEHACTLRGVGPGPGNWAAGTPASGTGGTYLEKPTGTNYPVVSMGPQWGWGGGTATNLTADAARGTNTATVASTAGITAGNLVIINELTDPNISHWNSQDPENASGWFEEPNRPLGDVMEVQSVTGNTVTFTTPLPVTYQVAQSAHLYPLQNVVHKAGLEDVYLYGGEGGDGGGGIHMWDCDHCWVKHIEDTWTVGAAIHIDQSFGTEVRDSYFHDSQGGLHNGGANYGVGINWYTSNTLVENSILFHFNKVDVFRSAGGGNVFGYNYLDDGADSGGQWMETVMNSSHMTTPHYELFEGNQAANFDQDDRWGNSVYITVFRNHLIGYNRDYSQYGPLRAAGVTQWHWWQSFVGNVLGTPAHPGISRYEDINPSNWGGSMWMVCWQASDNVPDGGKCQSTLLRDGNFDYVTGQVHWHGIGGTGANNGLTPPANSTLPNSLYLSSKPAFFGSNSWPWVDGSSSTNPLPGQLPARVRYDAGTPNGG